MYSIVDGRGIPYALGQKVARADKLFRADGCYVRECEVTKIADGKVYLDGSKQPMKFPERMMILCDKK